MERRSDAGVAQAFVNRGDIDQGIAEYEKLIQTEPRNIQIYYELVDLYARRGLLSKVTDLYLKIADIYSNDRDLEKRLEACNRIICLEPESIKAREKLLEIYSQIDDRDSVREQCFTLSRICSIQGQSEKALEFLQRGIDVDPDNLDARLELAIMNVKQGHIKEGMGQYKEVAQAFWEKGDLSKAADTYKRVTVLQPDDTETHLALGTLYRELGQLEDAKNAFRFILRYDLTHIKALSELALVCQEKGEIDSAILAFRKIIDINPMKTEAYEKLGELYEIRGQAQEAIKHYYSAAEDYQKQELSDKSIQMCEIILEIDPKHSKALRLMKELGYSGRPQPVSQSPVQGRPHEAVRAPRGLGGRPQSGIMMLPRGVEGGGNRPLGPKRVGVRGGPGQASTMRLPAGRVGGATSFPTKGSTRPLNQKILLDEESGEPDTDKNYKTYLPEEKGIYSVPDKILPVDSTLPSLEEESERSVPEPGRRSYPGSSSGDLEQPSESFVNSSQDFGTPSYENPDVKPRPKLISRRFGEGSDAKPALIRPREHGKSSSGELSSDASDRKSVALTPPLLSSRHQISDMPGENISSGISIGETKEGMEAPIAFSPDGLFFDEEGVQEESLPVRDAPVVTEEKPVLSEEETVKPEPSPKVAVVDFIREAEKVSTSSVPELSPTDEAVVDFKPELEEESEEEVHPQEEPIVMLESEESSSVPGKAVGVSLRIEEYRKTIKGNPGNSKARNELVKCLLSYGLLREALEAYREQMEIEKDNADIYQKLIDIYNLLGNAKELRETYMDLGELYSRSDRYDMALDTYQRLISLDNNDIEARKKMADILLMTEKKKEAIYQYIAVAKMYSSSGQINEVVDIYQKMLKIEPEGLLTHIKLAETYGQLGMKDKAIQEYLLTAEMYLDKKLWNNAIENYERISELSPEHLGAHLKLSQLYMQNGMTSKAIEANLVITEIYIKQDNLEAAMEMAQNVIGAEPEHIVAREKLIEIYRRKGLSNKAIADCQNLAEIYLKKNNLDKGIELYEKILQIDPTNYETHYKLAELYEKKGFTSKGLQEYIVMAEIFTRDGNYDAAVDAFRRALNLDQNNLEARYQLGVLLSDKKNSLESALEEFEIIRRLSPTHGEALHRLVSGYVKLGKLQQAMQISKDLKNKELLGEIVDQYKQAVEKNPDDYEARYNVGVIYKEFGDLENAIEQFQLLLKCPEKLLDAYNMLGLCFEQMGMGNLAINQFKKGLSSEGYRDEDYQELRYNLGLLYERRGMLKEALVIYEEAFGVDIKYRDVTQRIQQLEERLKG